MVGTAWKPWGACGEILELRYFGDLNYREISVELDLTKKPSVPGLVNAGTNSKPYAG